MLSLADLRLPPAERPDVTLVQHGERWILTVEDPLYADAKLRLLALGKPELEITIVSDRCRR